MRHRAVAVAALLSCTLPLQSCLLKKPGAEEEEPAAETMLSVENRHWSNVTVYVLRGNARVRMGTVTSMNTRTFVVPAVIVSSGPVDVRLIADPVGAEPYTSEPVSVAPGDHIEFRLANMLRQSSVWVWQ